MNRHQRRADYALARRRNNALRKTTLWDQSVITEPEMVAAGYKYFRLGRLTWRQARVLGAKVDRNTKVKK